MNNATVLILAAVFVPQIICLTLSVLKPTKMRWIVTQLVQWASLVVILAMMAYLGSLSDHRILIKSAVWPAYHYCFTAVSQLVYLMLITLILKSAFLDRKVTKMSVGKGLLDAGLGMIGGLLSFAVSFVFVQTFFVPTDQIVTEFIYFTLRVILPVVVVVSILEVFSGLTFVFVWLGAAVQYILLIVYAEPLYSYLYNGADLNNGFLGDNWLPYIGKNFLIPVAVTVLQFSVLLIIKLIRSRKTKGK